MDEDLYFSIIDEYLASERPVGVILLSPQREVLSINAAAEALLGISLEEAVGRRCEDLLGSDVCSSACPFDSVCSDGRTITRRVTLFSRSRMGPMTVQLSIAPITGPNGDRLGAVELICEEPRLDPRIERLGNIARESIHDRMKLAAITDSLSIGIVAVDRNHRITFMNKAAQELSGFDLVEVVGKRACQDAFQTNLCGSDCPLEQTLVEGQPRKDVELILINRYGEEVPARVSVNLLYDERGQMAGAVGTFQDLRELRRFIHGPAGQDRFDSIVGRHSRMLEIFEAIKIAAESDVRVLIRGESGTGKELIARAIHSHSHRKEAPFVKVVCGAMPESLLESELFGHVKGAFTGAHRDKQGRLELADGGTVFLDEVGDISLASQVKLLRFLQEQEFEPVGSNTTKKVDVRVIAATNKDLESLVEAGLFREDLFYRLNVFSISVPPLRDRKEDIPLLVSHILERLNARRPKGIRDLSPSALNILMEYDWPGNVRELENAIEHAFVCTKGHIILPHVLPAYLHHRTTPADEESQRPMDQWLSSRERDLILSSLEASNWRLTEASKKLGISRTTLWRKMKKHNISRQTR
jgi:PAS domain S-box-containing protein